MEAFVVFALLLGAFWYWIEKETKRHPEPSEILDPQAETILPGVIIND